MKMRELLSGVAGAVLLFLLPCSAWSATPQEALDSPIVVEFIETPLEDVAEFLTDYLRARVELDAGVNRSQPVTFNADNVPLKILFSKTITPLGLKYELEPQRILIRRIDSDLPPPEYGYRLTPAKALEGWISLFDGKTTFGFEGAKVEDGQLIGGRTTSEFGDYQLEAWLRKPGTLTLGGRQIEVGPKSRMIEVKHGRGPIILGDTTAVHRLVIRPLNLKSLLNGRDLTGWRRIDRQNIPAEKRPQWKVEDGVLRAIGGPGALEHEDLYGDFVLQVDARTVARHANGGVFFRSIPGDFMNGYEAQIYNRCLENDPGKPFTWSTGSLDDRQLARRLVSRDQVTFRMTIVANGPHLATWVNGHQLVDWTDTRPRHQNPRQGLRTDPGALQLQAHDPETDLEFHGVYVSSR